MIKILFNEFLRRLLEHNLIVASVYDRVIQYAAEYKLNTVKENQIGK